MGGYPPEGVTYGLGAPPLIGYTHKAEYHKGRIPAANSSIPIRRRILMVGYPTANGGVPTWRRILWNVYLSLMGDTLRAEYPTDWIIRR